MNQDSENLLPALFPDQRPPIEYFAAFLDGELSTDDWAKVQDWLANHPEDAALVEAHRDLVRCWRETAPAEPSERAWREVFARIERRGLKIEDRGSRTKDLSRGRWIRIGLLGGVAAAALILALVVPGQDQEDKTPSDIEELAILSAEDVDLISMEENDTRLLVVGNPPVQEPLVLVATGDVTLDSIEPDDDGFVPQARMNPGSSAAPMIIARLRGSETKRSMGK
jgi:ferric-dicitrate binding protein FerR (iron transport regulator)